MKGYVVGLAVALLYGAFTYARGYSRGGVEANEARTLQALQDGYKAGLRDGIRCMKHRNCYTISRDAGTFAKTLK